MILRDKRRALLLEERYAVIDGASDNVVLHQRDVQQRKKVHESGPSRHNHPDSILLTADSNSSAQQVRRSDGRPVQPRVSHMVAGRPEAQGHLKFR